MVEAGRAHTLDTRDPKWRLSCRRLCSVLFLRRKHAQLKRGPAASAAIAATLSLGHGTMQWLRG